MALFFTLICIAVLRDVFHTLFRYAEEITTSEVM